MDYFYSDPKAIRREFVLLFWIAFHFEGFQSATIAEKIKIKVETIPIQLLEPSGYYADDMYNKKDNNSFPKLSGAAANVIESMKKKNRNT